MKKLLIILIGLFMITLVSSALTDNLLWAVSMNETSGATVIDRTGNITTGTFHQVSRGTVGKINNSFTFGGNSTSYINMTTTTPTYNTTSVSLWVYPTNYNSGNLIAKNLNPTTEGYVIRYALNKTQIEIANTQTINGNITLPINTWSHVVVTWGNNGQRNKMYVNGQLAGDTLITTNQGSATSAPTNIGRRAWSGAEEPFTGRIDEVYLYNRTLDFSEVLQLYNSDSPIDYPFISVPSVTIIGPANQSIFLYGNATTFIWNNTMFTMGLTNTTFYLDGSLNTTINITGLNNQSSVTYNLSVGTHNWNIRTCGNQSNTCTNSSVYTLQINPYVINSVSYNTPTQETLSETYSLNITLNSLSSLTSANFVYNGSVYPASITSSGSIRIINSSIIVPNVTSSTNYSFYWNYTIDSVTFNSSTNYQIVNSLSIDNCAVNSLVMLNFTVRDEDNRSLIPTSNNITFDLYVQLTGDLSGEIFEYYAIRNTTSNTVRVCINNSLITGQNYYLDTVIQYTADNYATETYYIENYTMNTSAMYRNISLYLLSVTRSTEYLVTYKNSYLLPVEGALIELTRQYVSLPGFLTVEISKTDTDGQTVQHFVSNNEIYTVYVWKDGELLATFQNVRAFCNDVLTGDCTINLNELSSTTNPDSFTNYLGLPTTSTYNDTTKVYTVSYTGTSGINYNVSLNILLNNAYLNQSICSTSLVSSSGTLTCTIPAGYYNNTAVARLFINGQQAYSRTFAISPSTQAEQSPGRYILAFILILTIPLLGISSGPMMIILFFVGLATASGLSLLDSTWTAVGGALLWLIVAGVIILFKLMKRRELT